MSKAGTRKLVLLLVLVVVGCYGGSQVFGQMTGSSARRARTDRLRALLKDVRGDGAQPARTMRTADGYLRALCAPAGGYFEVEGISGRQPAAIGERFLDQWRDLVM